MPQAFDSAADDPREVRLRFDFADASGGQDARLFSRPAQIIVARIPAEVPAAMAAVEDGLRRGYHAAGFVAYEAAPGFDTALTTKPPSIVPLVWFGLFDAPQVVARLGDGGVDAAEQPAAETPWTPDISPDAYSAGIATVRDAIAEGESYQTNYTFRLRAAMTADGAEALYRRLAIDQRAPYAAYLEIGRWRILSLSPELFFRIDRNLITTRPMKGTAARGTSADDDARQAAGLRASEKNRAENVMIVDLARNDVGRIAEVGSVRVTHLFDIERYPSVFQMVSTVEGRLHPDTTLTDVFRALFPAGSITGAPKTSSMRLIASIEPGPRGIYCGAIGFASPDGDAIFNVAIRTATLDTLTGQAEFGTGGGITWDSRADDEYTEALAKTECLTPVDRFDLFETMRLEQGTCVRLTSHLDRLRRSCVYFGRPFAELTIRDAVEAHAERHRTDLRRVRVRLDASGTPHVSSETFPVPCAIPRPIALGSSPILRADRWLYHKTTRRSTYDRHRAQHPGMFDVLLWNEDGEVTEFTIGNLVVEIDGGKWTPPVTSGLLAGIFRATLLEGGLIQERLITLADLTRVSRLWLINSLREWVEVSLPDSPTVRKASDLRETPHQ